jgi:transcriptional regulator with XRE-family HTH domain
LAVVTYRKGLWMPTSPPEPPWPPYGKLIEAARDAEGIALREAASRAGISRQTWTDTVKGHKRRDRAWVPIRTKPRTIARMAAAVRLSPRRLEDDDLSPDPGTAALLRGAAEILREMARAPERYPLSPVPAGQDEASLPPGEERAEAEAEAIAAGVGALYPDLAGVARYIMGQSQKALEMRERELRGVLAAHGVTPGEQRALHFARNKRGTIASIR